MNVIVTMLLLAITGSSAETGNKTYEFVTAANVPVEVCLANAEKVNLDASLPFLVVCQQAIPDEFISQLPPFPSFEHGSKAPEPVKPKKPDVQA